MLNLWQHHPYITGNHHHLYHTAMRKFLLLFLALPLFAPAQLNKKIARIDSALTYLYQRQLFNGTVLIGEKGKILYKKAFGISGVNGSPLTTVSSFNLASVSKQFFAMMVMMLKEQGKLNYDDAVHQYLPTFPYPDITIRQLMTHTSGLPEYFDIAEQNMTLLDTLTNESMIKLLAEKKPSLRFKPGEKWEYCNTNYTTLASVIEKVAAMDCSKFFTQQIVSPLKLKNTYIYNLTMKTFPQSRVFGFHVEGGKAVADDLMRFDGIVGDGNIYSTVEDLYKWDQALYSGKLVAKTTFHEAITPARLNDGTPTKYGFGWFIEKPDVEISHTGSWVGFRALIVRYLQRDQTLIILDNSRNFRGRSIAMNILDDKPVQLPQSQLISNIRLIDGTGASSRQSSVRITDDRISDIGDLTPFTDESVIDGKGRVLAPGFIDNHSHHERGLLEDPDAIAPINQGITTIIIGQDGESDPVDTIKERMKLQPVSVNVATYTGHASLREMTMKGSLARTATAEEIESMGRILSDEIKKGSLGLSTGLEYEEAFYSSTDEVIQLAKIASKTGGRYISHIRSEDIHLESSIEEIIRIGKEAKLPVQISHIKIAMRSKWGHSPAILARLEQARAEGIDITADCYPYALWSSTPRVLFPKKDFTNPESALYATQELFDPAASIMTHFPNNPNYEGKTISEIAAMNNETPPQALMRVIRDGGGSIAGASMQENDIVNFLSWSNTSICSDGANGGHPRGYGAFTRVLGRYVREQKIMPLETAVYKMTGLTAAHLGIQDRGLITTGYFADLVLFDANTVGDNATMANPLLLSSGIDIVWVNGKIVFRQQQSTKEHPGLFIRRPENE